MTKMGIAGGILVILGAWALLSCGNRGHKSQISYELTLSPTRAIEFKSDLRNFALQNKYDFIDGSTETKEAREYINKESERSSGRGAELVGAGIEVVDVTVEPRDPGSEFLIFAKTSANDAGKVSLTVIYNKNSQREREMADNFSKSDFLHRWTQ